MDAQIYGAYHSYYQDKDHHWLKNSYLLSAFVNNQILIFIMIVTKLIIFVLVQAIILSSIQFLNNLVDQNPHVDMNTRFVLTYPSNLLSTCYSNWFPRYKRKKINFNSQRFNFIGLVWNLTQIMELIENQESCTSRHQSDHNTRSNNCHSNNHFPISIYNASCFSLFQIVEPIDLYHLSFHFSYTCQVVEALQPLLMGM